MEGGGVCQERTSGLLGNLVTCLEEFNNSNFESKKNSPSPKKGHTTRDGSSEIKFHRATFFKYLK